MQKLSVQNLRTLKTTLNLTEDRVNLQQAMVIKTDETGEIVSIEIQSDNRCYEIGDNTKYGVITGFRVRDKTILVCFKGPSQYGIKGLWNTILQDIKFL